MTVQQESSESRNPGRRYQEYTRNAPGIYQECTRNAPECTRNPGRKVPGMYQEFWYRTRNIPGIHQESWYRTRTTRNPPGIRGVVESSARDTESLVTNHKGVWSGIMMTNSYHLYSCLVQSFLVLLPKC